MSEEHAAAGATEPQTVEVSLLPDEESRRQAGTFGNHTRIYITDDLATVYLFQLTDALDGMRLSPDQVVTEDDKKRIPVRWRASAKVIMPMEDLKKFAIATLRLIERVERDRAEESKNP